MLLRSNTLTRTRSRAKPNSLGASAAIMSALARTTRAQRAESAAGTIASEASIPASEASSERERAERASGASSVRAKRDNSGQRAKRAPYASEASIPGLVTSQPRPPVVLPKQIRELFTHPAHNEGDRGVSHYTPPSKVIEKVNDCASHPPGV